MPASSLTCRNPLDGSMNGGLFLRQAKNPSYLWIVQVKSAETGEVRVDSDCQARRNIPVRIHDCFVSPGQKWERAERFSYLEGQLREHLVIYLTGKKRAGSIPLENRFLNCSHSVTSQFKMHFPLLAYMYLTPVLLFPIRKCYLIPFTAWWPLCGFPI